MECINLFFFIITKKQECFALKISNYFFGYLKNSLKLNEYVRLEQCFGEAGAMLW